MILTPKAIKHLKRDEKINEIISRVKPSFYLSGLSSHQALCKSIISQQLNIKAAAVIYNRFLALFENKQVNEQTLKRIPLEELRSVGLSKQKAAYIQNVNHFFIENSNLNELLLAKSDSEIIAILTQIKGVGEWTVQMLLIFTLGRLDVFPINDLAIRNAIIDIYKLSGSKKTVNQEMVKVARYWQPYRSVACLYLWASTNKNN